MKIVMSTNSQKEVLIYLTYFANATNFHSIMTMAVCCKTVKAEFILER